MKILLTGGGSGGHFYPLIAVAEEINLIIREEKLISAELFFMSDSEYDKNMLFDNDIKFIQVAAGKIRRYFSLQNLSDAFKTAGGLFQAITTIFSIYPDVVFSKGGYASFPAVFAARLFRIPIFIHESDSVPGRVNRWAGKFALRIAISYPETAKYFPADRMALTGNPTRKEIQVPVKEGSFESFGLDSNIATILVLGGSLGAEIINNAIIEILPEIVNKYQIIHQTGANNIKVVEQTSGVSLKDSKFKNRYKCVPYLDSVSLRQAAGASDLILSRAGAGAISEIAVWAKPSIVIPITDSNGDHQRQNAFTYAKSGACIVIEEENLKPHILSSEIDRIMNNKELLDQMSVSAKAFAKPDAGKKIAREIINIALSHES